MNLLDGLVRVVAQDGSVWWVKPSSAAVYSALQNAAVRVVDSVDTDYQRLYYGGQKHRLPKATD